MDDHFLTHLEMLVMSFARARANERTLSEFEHQCYESACRTLTAFLEMRRVVAERWLRDNEVKRDD